jgi:hypothetical protein
MIVKKDCRIVSRLRTELHAQTTQERFRRADGDFSRQPTLTFARVATLILRGHQVSQQNAVNKFFRELGLPERSVTGGAYCQARQKLKPELFVHLNQCVVEDFTLLSQADGTWRDWHGHRLLGGDGTKLNLPDTKAMRAAYSTVSNQYGALGEVVQGLAVVVYDLLNDLGVAAHLGKLAHEPDVLAHQLGTASTAGDVFVLDRNFADYAFIAWGIQQGRELIIRCPRSSFGVVNDFRESDLTDQVVTLHCSARRTTRVAVRAQGLPEVVTVRLLKFTLTTGETEVLLTTLCDQQRYPHAEFYQVYGWRWQQETWYDRLKNIFELERFSGLTPLAIAQDFYGVLFLMTLESTLAQSAQSALTTRSATRGVARVEPRVNRAVSYVSLLDHTVALLADPQRSLETVVAELHQLFQTNPKYNTAERKFDRPARSPARSAATVQEAAHLLSKYLALISLSVRAPFFDGSRELSTGRFSRPHTKTLAGTGGTLKASVQVMAKIYAGQGGKGDDKILAGKKHEMFLRQNSYLCER